MLPLDYRMKCIPFGVPKLLFLKKLFSLAHGHPEMELLSKYDEIMPFPGSGSQNVVPGPAASAPPGKPVRNVYFWAPPQTS